MQVLQEGKVHQRSLRVPSRGTASSLLRVVEERCVHKPYCRFFSITSSELHLQSRYEEGGLHVLPHYPQLHEGRELSVQPRSVDRGAASQSEEHIRRSRAGEAIGT